MNQKLKNYYSSSYSGILFVLFLLFFSSFYNFNIEKSFNDNLKEIFNSFEIKVKKYDDASVKYLVIDCPKIPIPLNNDSYYNVVSLLKTLEYLNPSVIILDSDPFITKKSNLYPWLTSGILKNKIVIVSPDIQNQYLNKEKSEIFANASFSINQKENLQVINFVNSNNMVSAGLKCAKIYNNDKSHLTTPKKIRFKFKDLNINRISLAEFYQKNLSKNSFNGKIILIRSGILSVFDKPFLTPIGMMNADTLLFNDIETHFDDSSINELTKLLQKILLFIFLLIIAIVFIKLKFLYAVFLSFIVLEFEILSAFILFSYYNISFNYFSFNIYGLILIIIMTITGIIKLIKSEKALEDFEQLKKNIIAQNKAIHSLQKLSELGKLSAGIYHEISNPLHNILNSLKLLNLEEKLSKESRETLDIAISEIDRLQKLSKNLKNFYKSSSEKPIQFDINESINFSLKLLKPSFISKNIEVYKNLYKSPVFITAEPDKIQQVFLNLLLNAIDAGSEKGKIWITTFVDETEIIVKIKDSGPGIPGNIRAEIFKAFFTTKGSFGSGLGLYVSYEIINSLGGDIIISDYVKNMGAEFIIKIPKN